MENQNNQSGFFISLKKNSLFLVFVLLLISAQVLNSDYFRVSEDNDVSHVEAIINRNFDALSTHVNNLADKIDISNPQTIINGDFQDINKLSDDDIVL